MSKTEQFQKRKNTRQKSATHKKVKSNLILSIVIKFPSNARTRMYIFPIYSRSRKSRKQNL